MVKVTAFQCLICEKKCATPRIKFKVSALIFDVNPYKYVTLFTEDMYIEGS